MLGSHEHASYNFESVFPRSGARGLEAGAGWATLVGPSVSWRLGLAWLVDDWLAGLAGWTRVGGLAGGEGCHGCGSNVPMLEWLAGRAGWLLAAGCC